MGVGANLDDTIDGDVGRQEAVEFVGEKGCVEGRLVVEMSDHQAGMDACIGASGSCNLDCLTAQEGGECFHQALLYADVSRLYLPAVVTGAVVG